MNTNRFNYKRPNGSLVRDVELGRLMEVAKMRLTTGDGPWNIVVNGEVRGLTLARKRALERLRYLLDHRGVGTTYVVKNQHGKAVLWAREVAWELLDCNGNDKADKAYTTILRMFASYNPRYAGSYVCKPSSQHRFGNALDFFFGTLAQQDVVANYFVKYADEYGIRHVISRDRIWTRGEGWRSYGGEYHSHIHIDFEPNFPTSWACGVRG